ncbi:APC membrane recruitment protein 3 [Spea bombifrons]|uniref:APC membrane recruitment protein 3 n=1 Tax=Spea bombifrons TaxID=233779 RepID=UPI0023495911|nr:APC membrane recruitment protein 3 [Spea bombifrons]
MEYYQAEKSKGFVKMDLIRGKTFIKSYAQNPPENVPSICSKVKRNVNAKADVGECVIKKNELSTQKTSKKAFMNGEEYSRRRGITKSKTHDCVSIEHTLEGNSTGNGKSRLSSSISFPQVERKENDSYIIGQSAYRQPMIDYRNFVPQMPFVPSVAKSLPKKRISLKRSKRGLRDIFNLKKNKQEDIISRNERLEPLIFEMKAGRKVGKQHLQSGVEMDSDELLTVELSDNEMPVDAVEACHRLCEDVASLKSFDSLTGCGEIFADESSAYIDFENGKDGPKVMFITKTSPLAVNFQGGVEKLASPAKSETIDFSRLCRQTCTSAGSLRPNSLIDTKLLPNSNFVNSKENNGNISVDQVSNSTYNDMVSSSENVTDAGSPISTSDEGYYDSFSPGTDDDKKEIENTTYFPQNSYSGDALYDLFYDSKATKLSTALDNEMPPLSEPNTDNPTSVYSFCVESEEELASQPDNDLVGDSIVQSSWKGRECFLKLCDTELTLTMGLVNWLKRTGEVSEHQVTSENVSNNQNEAPVKSIVEDSTKSLSVCNRTVNTREDTQSVAETQVCKREGHGNIYVANDSEHLQRDIISVLQTQGPSINVEEPVSKNISENQVSLLNTLPGEGKDTQDLSNPQVDLLTTMGYMHLLTSKDILSCFKKDNQKTFHCLDLQYLTGCGSPSLWVTDKKMVQIMEQCATQVASMHINHEVKICNSGETVIFFKSPNKFKEQLNNVEGLTQDSSAHFHAGSSKNKTDAYQSITGTGYIGKHAAVEFMPCCKLHLSTLKLWRINGIPCELRVGFV